MVLGMGRCARVPNDYVRRFVSDLVDAWLGRGLAKMAMHRDSNVVSRNFASLFQQRARIQVSPCFRPIPSHKNAALCIHAPRQVSSILIRQTLCPYEPAPSTPRSPLLTLPKFFNKKLLLK